MTSSRFSSSNIDVRGGTGAVRWQGRSGHFYELSAEANADFALKDHHLYVIVCNGQARWIGTAADVISDERSRAGFRKALKSASAVLSLPAPGDLVARMTLKWDLEGGEPASGFSLAGAA